MKKIKQGLINPKGIIESFTNNMESMRVFVRNVEPVVTAYDEKASKELEIYKSKIGEIISKRGKLTTGVNDVEIPKLAIPKEKVERVAEGIIKILREHSRLPRLTTANVEMLYKSSFVMLISFFDYLRYDIIHCYYKLFPESLSDKELSIDLSELKLCTDLDEAIDAILNRKVESILRESLEGQRLFFKKKLKIDLKETIINWDILNEAVERRNIIVHNNSIVNRRYLGNVDFSVLPEKRGAIKEGKQLVVTNEYFKRAYDEILVAGIALLQSCWRQWMKADMRAADLNLIKYIFEMLVREEWSVAQKIGLFSKEIKVYNAESRNILDINYCQSLKWQGKKAELNAELNKFDESNLSPRFRVALSVLKDDKDGLYRNMEKAVAIEEISKDDLDNWPLFRELRQDVEYYERIGQVFNKKGKAVKNG